MSHKIRLMLHQDKPTILDILRRIPEFKPAELEVAEEVVGSYLSDPSGSGYIILVAELDSSVVGYVCYGHRSLTEGTWDMYWLAVAPEMQGKRLGKSLVLSAEDDIKKAGGKLVLIETSSMPEYEKTRNFHCSNGYRLVARITDFYALGDDLLIYEKRFLQGTPA